MNKNRLQMRITWDMYERLAGSNRVYNNQIYIIYITLSNPTMLLEDIYFFDKIYKS